MADTLLKGCLRRVCHSLLYKFIGSYVNNHFETHDRYCGEAALRKSTILYVVKPFLSPDYNFVSSKSQMPEVSACGSQMTIVFPPTDYYLDPYFMCLYATNSSRSLCLYILYTWCPIKNDTVTLSHNFRLKYPIPNSSGDIMSIKLQTLCRKPCSIRLSGSEDMSDYVTEFKITFIQ